MSNISASSGETSADERLELKPTMESLQRQIFCYATDINKLMRQHSRLRQQYEMVLQILRGNTRSNDLLSGILLNTVAVHLITDEKGIVTFASPDAERALRGTEQGSTGRPIHLFLTGDDWKAVDALLARFSRAGGSGAIEQCALVATSPGEHPHLVTYNALVVQVRKHERYELCWLLQPADGALQSSLEIQKSMMFSEEARDGLLMTDATGQIVAVNAAFSRITGFSENEAVGQKPNLLGSGRNAMDYYPNSLSPASNEGRWSGELLLEWQTIKAVKNPEGGIVSYVAAFIDMSPPESDIRQLASMAYHDPLTGLPNRRLLEDRLAQAIPIAARHSAGLCVLFIDLDQFKPINDEFGHEVGDHVLSEISKRLQGAVRRGDTVARVGGDEFVVLLQKADFNADIEQIVDGMLVKISEPVVIGEREVSVSASIGCAIYPKDGEDTATLLHHADAAMYCAKKFGIGFCFYDTAAASTLEDIR